MTDAPETIVAAAIQWEGLTYSLPRPARHAHVLWCAADSVGKKYLSYVCQGFLTSDGRFVNRIQARHIAYMAGQNPKTTGNEQELFSEDLR